MEQTSSGRSFSYAEATKDSIVEHSRRSRHPTPGPSAEATKDSIVKHSKCNKVLHQGSPPLIALYDPRDPSRQVTSIVVNFFKLF
jgi:hypothetical protein